MRRLFERIALYSHKRPDAVALADSATSLTWRQLKANVDYFASLLDARRVAILMANSCAWAVLDLALQRRGETCIPLPAFFSDEQLTHVLDDSAADFVVTDQPERIAALLGMAPTLEFRVAGRTVAAFRPVGRAEPGFPAGTAKLTYTSGTTGRPKGVCIGAQAMATVAANLGEAVNATSYDRSLSLLPLSTLLENIGGLYAPLYRGAAACLPDLADCGLAGSSEVEPARLVAALARFRPTSMIVVPQLLKVLVEAFESGAPPPRQLRFVAVGGARTAPALLERARAVAVPVYEGYGLSEACSVVSINLPGCDRPGSVGKPLPHAGVRIAADGEIIVTGTLFSGYLGRPGAPSTQWATGDLGYIDADGYLHVSGRKRNAYATAFGRNVSPEWVEGELLADDALIQAAVFGEARPYNIAVVVPRPGADSASVATAVGRANRRLPDYARVHRWAIAEAPFSPHNGLASAAGAVNRDAVGAAHNTAILSLFSDEETNAVV